MKNLTFLLLLCSFIGFSQQQTITYSIAPASFEESQSITITINGSSVNESTWAVTDHSLYIWAWSLDANNVSQDCPTNGTWDISNETNKFTYNADDDTYTKTLVPSEFYNRTGIAKMGFLVKAKNGNGDKKSQDIIVNVGVFQVNLTAPAVNSASILPSGGSLTVTASNTGGPATYNLVANGTSVNTATTSSYSFTHMGITANQSYTLEVTQGTTVISKNFSVIVAPLVIVTQMEEGLRDGINYNPSDPTKATLVLDAPGKDFIYVAGSFNNWQPGPDHSMRQDSATGKFFLELSGLTPGLAYSYQYWVVDQTPIAGSPVLVKTADPYSTLVLSPYDDSEIISLGKYPNLPPYPEGQDREVTVLQTAQVPYNWQVTNFTKPAKEDLVIYEVLIRDFASGRKYQDLIDNIGYFKGLNINAIELMPVMEFEGNESWGYNTAFHLANDKFYGPGDKLKEFIDLCHQNGIAVILDVALNHAFGRNPMVRMWMADPDGDGWGDPSEDSPYFNTVAKHAYSVGCDFNHQQPRTQNYVKRVIEHWIEEYKIDGFRWDLTKGFTQNCSASDTGCTEAYQQDRVDILKAYADYSWSLDPTHYTIFEHLGSATEEQQWANYKIEEGKGVMLWEKTTTAYNQLTMGFADNSNIAGVGNVSHGFTGKRALGYAESHDEERLMYKNIVSGNNSSPSYNVRNLDVALSRMPALGAVLFTVPGPKMIWHFSDLGWDESIWTCPDGSVNTDSDATDGNCKLDTKPQPQWSESWLANVQRKKIYDAWSRIIALRLHEPVFRGSYTIPAGNSLLQKIYITDATIPDNQLKDVVVLSNFNVLQQTIIPNFPYAGTWNNLMDGTTIQVVNPAIGIVLQPGEFRIYGNQPTTLGMGDLAAEKAVLYPNPATSQFTLNIPASKVAVYAVTGQLVKSFGASAPYDVFDISDLGSGIYIVKILDSNNRQNTMKLVRE